jgi:hypothetical protein
MQMREWKVLEPTLTQVLLAILSLGVWGLLLRPLVLPGPARAQAASTPASARFDTLTVQRINVIDADGKTRLVIANRERFPDVVLHGKVYPRSIHDTAGLVFFDTNGVETGGLGLAKLRDNDVANITFDFTAPLTDGIRMIKQESADGRSWKAGFNILDRRPQGSSDDSSQGVQRITLADENQNAQLVIADKEGRPRIRIGVDKAGTPIIETLDAAGAVRYRAGD